MRGFVVGSIVAEWGGMIAYTLFVFMACSNPDLPELIIPPNTLILRESFQGPGSERTGNWWGRFDQQGCWWEAHNE